MAVVAEIGALVVAILILYVLYLILKNSVHLLINAVIGIIILMVINMFLVRDVAINFFSVAVVAIAGIPGVLLVLLIHFLGWGF